jgi:hypothetical protein
MIEPIKITSLSNIGSNIATSTLIPVVDMGGTPTTKKANLQILGNLILNGATGSTFTRAAQSNIALSVANSHQPNITSTGTLTSLTVSGNVNLGPVNNLTITGGNLGQVLTTDGNGNLSWVNDSEAIYGNANVASYLPTYTGSLDSLQGNIVTSGNISANYFIGNGSQLTDISASVVSSNLTFSDTSIQDTAYSGGVGHMYMIDTNRTDDYIEVGSTDRPFKTLTAAINAANAIASVPGASDNDKIFAFVLMGCTVTENIDFNNTALLNVTMSTACRSRIVGDIIFTDVPSLSQLVIRNLEIDGEFIVQGNGQLGQLTTIAIYNTGFRGRVSITAANTVAFYDVVFFSTVEFTNLNYLYMIGGQTTQLLTIMVDNTGDYPIPYTGVTPGVGVIYSTISTNVALLRGGSASCVLLPHMSRIGRPEGSYTVPEGFNVFQYGTTLRGTWTNLGSITMNNSSSEIRIKGNSPTYAGVIGGQQIVAKSTPATSKGVEGDREGMIAADSSYFYVCVSDWTDGQADIWSRTAIAASSW